MALCSQLLNRLSGLTVYTAPKLRCLAQAKTCQVTQKCTEYTRPGYGSRYGFTNWQMKKDFHKRECVKEGYPERMRLNAIRKNSILPKQLQVIADKDVAALPRDSNYIRTKNRCALTGRARGTKTRYHISRIMYRKFVDYNCMSGVKRACW